MNRLKELREEAMMTVRELSERSGVSADTITKIENGHRKGRGMTLRKLARALEVDSHLLSAELLSGPAGGKSAGGTVRTSPSNPFGTEGDLPDPTTMKVMQSRVSEATSAAEQPPPNPPQRRDSDAVPRMNVSERQQKVLLTILEYGEVDPSTVADLLEISVSTAYRDLSVLEEYGLVMRDDSGTWVVSPLGRDLAETIINHKAANSGNPMHYDEALNQIAALIKTYEMTGEFDPNRATALEAEHFFLLQQSIIQSIRLIVAATEPSPRAEQGLNNNLLAKRASAELQAD